MQNKHIDYEGIARLSGIVQLPTPVSGSLPRRYSNEQLALLYHTLFDQNMLKMGGVYVENLDHGIRSNVLEPSRSYRVTFDLTPDANPNLVSNAVSPENARVILAEVQEVDTSGYAHAVSVIVDKRNRPSVIYFNNPMGGEPSTNLERAIKARYGNHEIKVIPGQIQQDANACTVFTLHNLLEVAYALSRNPRLNLGSSYSLTSIPLEEMVMGDRRLLDTLCQEDGRAVAARIRVVSSRPIPHEKQDDGFWRWLMETLFPRSQGAQEQPGVTELPRVRLVPQPSRIRVVPPNMVSDRERF